MELNFKLKMYFIFPNFHQFIYLINLNSLTFIFKVMTILFMTLIVLKTKSEDSFK